jgi:hypothetical protein
MACPNAERIAAIEAELARMRETLSGCDWCCGGGDAEWAALYEELEGLRR